MSSERNNPIPTRIGLGTAVKWAQAQGADLTGAMKSRARGGVINPHGTVFTFLLSYLRKRRSLAQCLEFIASLPTAAARSEFGQAFSNFIDYLGTGTWEAGAVQLTNPISAPKGVLLAGTKAHFSFERDGRKHWGLIWNNKTPALGLDAAHFGCALMRQGVEANDNDLFEVTDVRRGLTYALSTAEIDDGHGSLAAKLEMLEEAYIRVAG